MYVCDDAGALEFVHVFWLNVLCALWNLQGNAL
jgi:hypothetical protein